MSKKNKINKQYQGGEDIKSLTNRIMGLFANNPKRKYNYKQIAADLSVNDTNGRQLIIRILGELTSTKIIEELNKGSYRSKNREGNLVGKVQMTSRGYAYIISDQLEEDVFVSQKNLNHALDGDVVKVFVYAQKKSRQIEGEVVEVIKRARTTFVGRLEVSDTFAFMISDSRRMPYDIFIPGNKLKGGEHGQKVIAKITEWPQLGKNPVGEVVRVLGSAGENETEMHAILAEFELPIDYPAEVNAEADKIPDAISSDEIAKRRDFRNITTFTIDPRDAKDFDDALSFRKLENGNIEIGVHIADVTHYVTPGSIIDEEGYNRATSIYLVDRVVPMLPERLSNFVCSLRPNEEKLCFSAVFEMDADAKVINEWFGRTVILSNRRFTYEEAQAVIETKKGDFAEEILVLHNLAQKIRKRRFTFGSIDFDRMEVKFVIDEQGVPLGIELKVNKESNQLIEEFMLLANRSVATLFDEEKGKAKKYPFVYRIHDLPNSEKLGSINYFIKRFGYRIDLRVKERLSESINKLMEEVRGKKEQNLIEVLMLRAMSKARYSTKNIGHYGLAFPFYTHFTSPIRRYPDMMVHRILNDYLTNQGVRKSDSLEKACEHCSNREKLAMEAERASIKYKQVEYMLDKIGNVYDGVISGVAHLGIFVEIEENKCEGLVPVSELDDDFYEYDEDNFRLIGRKSHRIFQLGDGIKIKIAKADLANKRLDFLLAE